VTKPIALLQSASRSLEDQTNATAVVEVVNFIQPVVDVERLENRLFSLASRVTMTGAVAYEFLHGPVPLGKEWIYDEINLVKEGGLVKNFVARARFEDPLLGTIHLNIARGDDVLGFNDVNFTRLLGDTAATNSSSSTKEIKLYPGMFLSIISDSPMVVGDIVRTLILYRERSSPVAKHLINDNAANLVVTTV